MVFYDDYCSGSGHDFSFGDQIFDRDCYSGLAQDLKQYETLSCDRETSIQTTSGRVTASQKTAKI